MRREALLPIFSVLGASVIWGSAYTTNKITLGYGSPAQMLLVQLTGSMLFLILSCLILRTPLAAFRRAGRLWWTGLLEPGVTYWFAMSGLKHSSAGLASIIISSESIVVVLIVALLGWEVLTRSFVFISLFSFVGLFLVIVVGNPQSLAGSFGWQGIGFLAAATIAAACYNVASARLIGQQPPLVVVTVQQSAALVLYAALNFATSNNSLLEVALTHTKALFWIAISGVIQYGMGFFLFLFALKHLSASKASAYLNLIPVVGVAASFIGLHETMSSLQVIGCVMVIAALFALSYLHIATQSEGTA